MSDKEQAVPSGSGSKPGEKRKRGRPRKPKPDQPEEPKPKRPRGRPPGSKKTTTKKEKSSSDGFYELLNWLLVASSNEKQFGSPTMVTSVCLKSKEYTPKKPRGRPKKQPEAGSK